MLDEKDPPRPVARRSPLPPCTSSHGDMAPSQRCRYEFGRDLLVFREAKGWQALTDAAGQPFKSFRDFVLARRPHGLHIPPQAYKGLMRDLDKALQEQAEDAEAHALEGHGGKRE